MADERMVPLLPCASVHEIRDFYLAFATGLRKQFGSLVDPAGTWIRVTVEGGAAAIKILELGLRRTKPWVPPIERLEATVYLAELLLRGSDPDRAAQLLAEVRSEQESSEEAAPLLRQAEDLEATLAAGP